MSESWNIGQCYIHEDVLSQMNGIEGTSIPALVWDYGHYVDEGLRTWHYVGSVIKVGFVQKPLT